MLREPDLVEPAIKALRHFGGEATTSNIKDYMLKHMDIDSHDLVELPSGHIRIEQKIRNLKSNKHLERLGIAEPIEEGFRLTELGRTLTYGEIHKRMNSIHTKILSPQAALNIVAKEYKASGIHFKDERKCASDIRALIAELPPHKNDFELLEAVREIFEAYIEENNIIVLN